MIRQLKNKDSIGVYEFLNRTKDTFEDFYITKDRQRIFINTLTVIEKLIKYQEVYAIDTGDFNAIFIIIREKGFRSYIKILAENNDYLEDLLKFINWNFNEDLFLKVKKINPLAKLIQGAFWYDSKGIQHFYWEFCGSRGQEILFIHKKRELKNDRHYIKN